MPFLKPIPSCSHWCLMLYLKPGHGGRLLLFYFSPLEKNSQFWTVSPSNRAVPSVLCSWPPYPICPCLGTPDRRPMEPLGRPKIGLGRCTPPLCLPPGRTSGFVWCWSQQADPHLFVFLAVPDRKLYCFFGTLCEGWQKPARGHMHWGSRSYSQRPHCWAEALLLGAGLARWWQVRACWWSKITLFLVPMQCFSILYYLLSFL